MNNAIRSRSNHGDRRRSIVISAICWIKHWSVLSKYSFIFEISKHLESVHAIENTSKIDNFRIWLFFTNGGEFESSGVQLASCRSSDSEVQIFLWCVSTRSLWFLVVFWRSPIDAINVLIFAACSLIVRDWALIIADLDWEICLWFVAKFRF